MSTKGLSRAELVTQSFDCCKQVVLSYGPDKLDNKIRNQLVKMMEYHHQMALSDIGKE